MRIKLRLSARDHELLRQHLLPGDGFEAVAVALCGRRRSRSDHCLTVRSIVPIPYFDVGVKLVSDGRGGIDEALGAVHYVRPDGSTLQDRRVYTADQLKSAGLRRTDPKAYREQVKAGYIKGVDEERPAVISINMQLASTAINEFLARLHPYRYDDNADFAMVRTSFIQGAHYREPEGQPSGAFSRQLGKADVRPLLSMPELSEPEEAL